MSLETIGSREGSHPLELSGGCSFEGLVSDEAGYSFEDVVSDDASVGRSAPLHPLGDGVREGCDPLALSRSCSDGSSGFRRRGRGALRFPTPPSGDGRREGCDPLALSRSCSDESVGFRRNGRGALCSPAPPRVTGVREGCDPLALSRSCSDEGLVFDKVVLVRFISFRAYASISRSPSYKGGFKDVLIPDSMPVGCVCPVGEL